MHQYAVLPPQDKASEISFWRAFHHNITRNAATAALWNYVKGEEKMENRCCCRSAIKYGMLVDIVLKKDQPTGIPTRGVVGRLLTNKKYHPRGIKVMLQNGQVGRVQHIVDSEEYDTLI